MSYIFLLWFVTIAEWIAVLLLCTCVTSQSPSLFSPPSCPQVCLGLWQLGSAERELRSQRTQQKTRATKSSRLLWSSCALFVSFPAMTSSSLYNFAEPQSFPMLQLFALKCQIVFNHMCQVAPHEDGCLPNHSDVCFTSDHNKRGHVETLARAGSPFYCNCLVRVRAALFIAPLKVKYISY